MVIKQWTQLFLQAQIIHIWAVGSRGTYINAAVQPAAAQVLKESQVSTAAGVEQPPWLCVCVCVCVCVCLSCGCVALQVCCHGCCVEVLRSDGAAEELSVSELLERANRNLVRSVDEPALVEGDVAVDGEAGRNADPCTARGCMWGKWSDGKVYVPYYITNHFSSREKAIITRGLESFSSFSCIRFRPTKSSDRDWLSIESQNGCYSYVGRRGGKQVVSLARRGCLYHGTVQHELLHALGFNHEQTRNDRDRHIKVLLQNVQSGKWSHNFRKIATLNQGTSYDYNSVMQYHKYAFSKNNQPTMLPIPNSNVSFGNAKEMSRADIARLNTLYKCLTCKRTQLNLCCRSNIVEVLGTINLQHWILINGTSLKKKKKKSSVQKLEADSP
uniref:Metalloendopeptidase n=1 Tax=Salarias fasciatus TaxID=181472 RepID=A0A672G1U4_SALFA